MSLVLGLRIGHRARRMGHGVDKLICQLGHYVSALCALRYALSFFNRNPEPFNLFLFDTGLPLTYTITEQR